MGEDEPDEEPDYEPDYWNNTEPEEKPQTYDYDTMKTDFDEDAFINEGSSDEDQIFVDSDEDDQEQLEEGLKKSEKGKIKSKSDFADLEEFAHLLEESGYEESNQRQSVSKKRKRSKLSKGNDSGVKKVNKRPKKKSQ